MSQGRITIDLLAKTGSFETDLNRAAKHAEKRAREIAAAHKKAADEIKGMFSNIGGMVAGALGGLTVGSVITKFIQETRDAEQEQAQLAAVLKSTGEAAGWSQTQLNDMATSLANASTFSEGAINQAQTRLLSYTGIVGEKVPEAMQAVADMSARLGMDLNQSAETIGKALDVPSQGLSALSKQGFRFTDDQKKLVEQLEATGQTAKAQGIILEALSSSYGGAAQAARNTFGGALAALQNTINDLLTGDSGSMSQMKQSVESLNQTLASEDTKAAFGFITGEIGNMVSMIASAVGTIGSLIGKIQDLRREAGDGSFLEKVIKAARHVVNPIGAAYDAVKGAFGTQSGPQATQASVRAIDNAISARPAPRIGSAVSGGSKAGRGGGGRANGVNEAERYLENLKKQLQATKELTVSETLLADIQAGRLGKVTEAQRASLMATAQQIDAAKAAAVAHAENQEAFDAFVSDLQKKSAEQAQAAREVWDQTRTPLEKYNAELERLKVLLNDGAISADTHGRAVKKLSEDYESTTKKMDTFGERFAENTQKNMGDGVYDILSGKFENIGDRWADMLKRMAADAIAADISRSLFGDLVEGGSGKGLFGGLFGGSGKSGGGSDILGGLISGIGGFFSGKFFADGGIPPVGKASVVGERGPELFIPNTAGRIIPNHALGGGQTVQNNYFTVGDVATVSMVKQAVANSQRQAAGALGRSRSYGGVAAV